MHVNGVKRALREGQTQFGIQLGQFRSPEVPKILAAAGYDWLWVDAEHGGFDWESIQDLCRTANLSGISPLVRVADLQYSLVARALDCGAHGIIFPRVESPDLLQAAVSWAKFPPEGTRGFGLAPFHLEWKSAPVPEIISEANANTLVVLQIETKAAFDIREELLSVPGVDVVMVGPMDLSISLGAPGDFENARFVETVEGIREACVRHGVVPGIHTRTAALANFWKERGMLLVSCGNEASMLFEKAREIRNQLA
jgi:2-keto-3-deoxy-L-rhamnonate aldolase RhmA